MTAQSGCAEMESYKIALYTYCLSTRCILKVCKLLCTLFRGRNVQRLLFICIKIAWITWTFWFWQKWSFNLHIKYTNIHCTSDVHYIEKMIIFFNKTTITAVITARCIIVHSAVLRLHVVRPSIRLSGCNVGGSGPHRLEILESNCTHN